MVVLMSTWTVRGDEGERLLSRIQELRLGPASDEVDMLEMTPVLVARAFSSLTALDDPLMTDWIELDPAGARQEQNPRPALCSVHS